MLTGVGAVVNTARVPVGASVAIVGLGGVGLAAVIGAVAAGARRIVAVDLAPAKLDHALRLGATDAVDAGAPDAVKQIKDITHGGAEFCIEFRQAPCRRSSSPMPRRRAAASPSPPACRIPTASWRSRR